MPVAEVRAIAQNVVAANSKSTAKPVSLTKDFQSTIRLELDDPAADRVELERLARACQCFSPITGVEDADPADTLMLDVSSTLHLFAAPKARSTRTSAPVVDEADCANTCLAHSFLSQVQKKFRKLRLAARLGLAETVGAAWAMAHYGMMLDKAVGGGKQSTVHSTGQPELQVVTPGDVNLLRTSLGTRKRILQLPIAALRLPTDDLVVLDRLGFEQITDLVSLPRGELKARFGTVLLSRLDQLLLTQDSAAEIQNSSSRLANGPVSSCGVLTSSLELLDSVSEPLNFSVEQVFEYPVADRGTIELVTGQLLQRLCTLLGKQNQGALELTCRLLTEVENDTDTQQVFQSSSSNHPASSSSNPISSRQTFSVGLFRPTADSAHVQDLFAMHLERLALTQPVIEIAILVKRHAPLDLYQRKLFGNASGISPLSRGGNEIGDEKHRAREVASLVDRLTCRLGPQSVVQCQLNADAQPEEAYSEIPFWQSRNLKRTRQKKAGRGTSLAGAEPRRVTSPGNSSRLARPLYLFPTPVALQVFSLDSHGAPVFFLWQGQRHNVAFCWGPERIDTGWWRHRRASKRAGRSPRMTRKSGVALRDRTDEDRTAKDCSGSKSVAQDGNSQSLQSTPEITPPSKNLPQALLGIARDYYRAETVQGFRFWIYRCLRSGDWFLHGKY